MSLFRDLYQNPNDDHTINLMMIDNRFVKSKSELSLLLFSLYLLLLLSRMQRRYPRSSKSNRRRRKNSWNLDDLVLAISSFLDRSIVWSANGFHRGWNACSQFRGMRSRKFSARSRTTCRSCLVTRLSALTPRVIRDFVRTRRGNDRPPPLAPSVWQMDRQVCEGIHPRVWLRA